MRANVRTCRRHLAVLLAVLCAPALRAQDSTRTPIQDNSFLVEEAYNQERGVVQHIGTFAHPTTGRAWTYSFTQEWPAPGQRHQLSYTIPVAQLEAAAARGIGDVALNYRYQLRGMRGERVAVAPRLSVLLPTGNAARGTGAGGASVQANLPVSAQLSRTVVAHLNAGVTVTPHGRVDGIAVRTTSWNTGESVIWLLRQRVNLMLEAFQLTAESTDDGGRRSRDEQLLVSPGIRWSYDLANGTQIVPGIAVPLGVGKSRGDKSLFLYFSVEHPF